MGRNRWDRNRDNDKKDTNKTSSIQPLWKKRKVIGERDMDAYDDDVHYTRIASRTSPPPVEPKPEPPESKFKHRVKQESKHRIKQESKPKPGDISIFNNINQSWDYNQKGSTFLEETPIPHDFFKPDPDSIPGFSSSSNDAPNIKPHLPTSSQKTGLSSAVGTVKLEPEDDVPSPKLNLPPLEQIDTDDEDDYLYGDAGDDSKNAEKDITPACNDIPMEQSPIQGNYNHAALDGYKKSLAQMGKTPLTAACDTSKEAQQRVQDIAKRVTEMFGSTPCASVTQVPEEKSRDPRMRAKPKQVSDANTGRSSSAFNSSASLASGSTTPRPANYDQVFNGRMPVAIPGLQPLPIRPPPAKSAYPSHAQNPGWVSPLTPVRVSTTKPHASQSSLKGTEMQRGGATAGSGMTYKAASAEGGPVPRVEEVKTPRNVFDRNRLIQERLDMIKRLDKLNSQLYDCQKQQEELLRNKPRQKDGHKDPHVIKLVAAQELYSAQLKPIKRKLESIDRALKSSEYLSRKPAEPSGSSLASNTNLASGISAESVPVSKEICNGKNTKEPAKPQDSNHGISIPDKYRYVDNGNHWCKQCHETFKLATDLLKHLLAKHPDTVEKLPPSDRPWASKPQESGSDLTNLVIQPFQGVEFMLPSPKAFYCSLCCEFSGDLIEARNHLESEKHNYNHSKYCLSNPDYLKRVKTEHASMLEKRKEESRRKHEMPSKDKKRKREESRKDGHKSRHSKSSSSRNNPSREFNLFSNDNDNDSSMKKHSSTKTGNLEKERLESGVNNDSSCTIDTQISSKSTGKGVNTPLESSKVSKNPKALPVEDQSSNLKKKTTRDKSDGGMPLPSEGPLGGEPQRNYRLPEKDSQMPTTVSLPPRLEDNTLQPPAGIRNESLSTSSKNAKSQLPAITNFDTGNLDNLSQILDAIPIPQELDELAKFMEDNMAKEFMITETSKDVEMQDVGESGKPKKSTTKSADQNPSSSAAKDVTDDKPSDDVPDASVGCNPDIAAESETPNEGFTFVIGNVTSLSDFNNGETFTNENDSEMPDTAELLNKGDESQATLKSSSQHNVQPKVIVKQEFEPKMDECSADGNAAVHSAKIPQASQTNSDAALHFPEDAHLERPDSPMDTNYNSDVSTDEYDDSSIAEQPRLIKSGENPQKSLLQECEKTAGGTKHTQPEVCKVAKLPPSYSVVIKQEKCVDDKLKMPPEKTVPAKGAGPARNPFLMVIKQEPVSPPRDDTSIIDRTSLFSTAKNGAQDPMKNIRVKIEPGTVENVESAINSGPTRDEEVELPRTMPLLQNLGANSIAGNETPYNRTRTNKGLKVERSFSQEKFDDALLEDENTVDFPPVAFEGEEKLDDNLLNDPDSGHSQG